MSITATVDLRPLFGAARNQSVRPTCTAFACSDLHASCRQPWTALSCEYAFQKGVRRQGTTPYGGVYLHHMLDVIEHDGQPVEAAWPYLVAVPSDLTKWIPPGAIGSLFYGLGQSLKGDLAAVRAELDQNRPTLIVMTISNGFYVPDSDGVIDSAEVVDPSRIHALVAVGYGVCGQETFTLVRNSWGPAWGLQGYGWISDRYLAPRLQQFATITKVI